MNILYISHDGVTDHIGRSQVAPYLMALARRGYRITVVSAEKHGREDLIEDYAAAFRDCGMEWRYVRYRNKPPLLGQAMTLLQLYRLSRSVLAHGRFGLIHCRDLLATSIGYRLKQESGIKLLYDFRNFSADGGLETSPYKFIYRYLKRRERDYIRSADKVVCLTERAAEVLANWYLQDQAQPKARFQVIPCCADFDHFAPDHTCPDTTRQLAQRLRLAPGAPVLLYLGSLGPDYLLSQMLRLFRQLLTVEPEARFLFVSNNGRPLVEELCVSQGIRPDQIRFVCADRRDVPAYISLATLSVMFIRPSPSKAGCSPTKLAELFACNVPVIANAGVGDLDRILSLDRNGSVIVSDFEDETLVTAVRQVLDRRARQAVDIRSNSREFALEAGVESYAAVYAQLVEPPLRMAERCAAPRRQETAIAQ